MEDMKAPPDVQYLCCTPVCTVQFAEYFAEVVKSSEVFVKIVGIDSIRTAEVRAQGRAHRE